MALSKYPLNELQDLKGVLEEKMKASVDDAFKFQKWYDRVSEAIHDVTGTDFISDRDEITDEDHIYEEKNGYVNEY